MSWRWTACRSTFRFLKSSLGWKGMREGQGMEGAEGEGPGSYSERG